MNKNRKTADEIFGAFVASFEGHLREQLRARVPGVSASIDEAIARLGREKRPVLKQAFVLAVADAIGKSIPRDRLGDRVIAYEEFVLSHFRVPGERMLFNDVLYRIKTTDEIINPLRVFVSDKEFVKFFIKAMVGGEYNVPTYAVLESEAEVERYKFPPRCFIKATHGSAMMLIRREGEPVDTQPIKSWFRMNYYLKYREANYRHLKAKVIVEPHIFDNMNAPDYKFFCVNGTPRLAFVNVDSRFGKKRAFFDISWNRLNFGLGYPLPDTAIARPGNLQEMLEVAARLSSKFSFVRIDLYSDGSSCRVGEITNCHAHASSRFLPAVAEEEASRMLFH